MNDYVLNLIIQAKNLSSNVFNQVKGQIGDLTKASQSLAKDGFNKIGSAIDNTTNLMKGAVIGGGILAATFAGIGFNNAVQIQSGMADVQKSAGLVGSEISELRDKILDLSTTTQTKAFDLIGIAKIGGAIGVAKDDLLAFTASIDKVSTALGDEFTGGAEEVSSKLGTLRNLFKDTSGIAYSDAMMRIGSSINSLGASGTATGPVVSEFAARIGQLGPALSPTITETLGLGAAFQEMGLSAEISSGGLSNILLTAGNKAPKFAEQMGISTQAFDEMIKKSPNEMLLQLAKSFENIADDPIKLAQTMTTLGIGSQEATKVMSLLSSKTDLVREKQKLASDEFAKGTSILDEYNIKNNTMSALFGKAQNVFTKFSSALWNANLGAIGDQFQRLIDYVAKFDFGPAISKTTEFANQLKNTFNDLDLFGKNLENTKTVAAGVAGVISTLLVGSLISLAGSVIAATWPFALLGLAFSGLYIIYQNNKQAIDEFVNGAWENMKKAFVYLKDTVLPDLQNKFKQVQKWFEENRPLTENLALFLGSFAAAWAIVTTAIAIYTGVIGIATTATTIFGGVVAFLTSPFGIAVIAIGLLIAAGVLLWKNWDWIKAKAFEIGSSVAGWFAQKWKEIGDWFNWLGNEASRIWNEMLVSVGEFGKSVDSFFREMINNIVNGFNGLDMWQIGSNIMTGLGNGLWGMVDVAMGPINWLMDQVNAVLGKQAQAQNNSQGAYNDSRAVSGKGSASQWGFAKGGAFENGNVVAFADGGVVNSPTNFAMSGGRTGLMGEAGAEAIMPLTRGSDGKLGVKAEGAGGATIINNFYGVRLETESDRLDLVRKLKDMFKKEFPTLRTN